MIPDELAITTARAALAAGLPGSAPEDFYFLCLSGAHAYGFPSVDSDLDIRGAHLLPESAFLGLDDPADTYESLGVFFDNVELDCVSYDLKKFLRLLTKQTGNMLDQLFSALVVHDGGHLEELRALALRSMTKNVAKHFRGLHKNKVREVERSETPTAKAVLYAYRAVMVGIHLLETKRMDPNVVNVNDAHFRLPQIQELVDRKRTGGEHGRLDVAARDLHLKELEKLVVQLEACTEASDLPEAVSNLSEIDAFLRRARKPT